MGKGMKELSEEQYKVLKEIFSDAELTASFLTKACTYIYLTTNSNETKIAFEGSSKDLIVAGTLKCRIMEKLE